MNDEQYVPRKSIFVTLFKGHLKLAKEILLQQNLPFGGRGTRTRDFTLLDTLTSTPPPLRDTDLG